jgi:tetratricopeptide (TPR) repeat protein
LEYALNSYREEITEHLLKRKRDNLIANSAIPSKIEDAFNKAFYLMNTDEFLRYNGTNYYYNIEFDLKYYKAEKFPYKSRKKEDTINAIPLLSAVINQNPKFSFAFLLRGFARYCTDSFKEAIEDYNKFINFVPDDEVGWYLRAKANNGSNNYKAAIDDYLKFIDLIKSYSHYPYLSHYRYVFIDRDGKIVDLYERIPIIPILSELYYDLAFIFSMIDNYSEAMANYNKSIEIDPNKFYAFANRGTLKLNLKDFEGAQTDYNKAIELNPKIAGLYFNRGNAKYNLSNYESSIEDYNKAIELDPTIESAITNRSKAQEKLKNSQAS